MHQSRSGLLDPVLENTLFLYKRGGAACETGSGSGSFGANVAPCLSGADSSFMNSVTGSGL